MHALYDYNRWANLRLLDAAAVLPREQFAAHVTSSFSSLRDTFAHIAGVEWIWLRRCNGDGRAGAPPWMSGASPEILREQLDAIRDGQRALIDSADPERVIEYVNLKGVASAYPLGVVLQHVPNHSNYHRGQVVTIFRQLGAAAPGTDYLLFAGESR